MRVGILGSLVLDIGTGPAAVGGARLRALLARLVLDPGRAVRPESLAEALWEDTAPADNLHALQSLVSRLRRVLGDPAMVTSDSAGYRLAIEPDAVDAVRFERLVRVGRRAYAESRPAEAAAVLREALSLWRGPALADVREAPFAAVEAERLERARLAAVEDRVEADLAIGADLDLVAELESLTAEHPLRERLGAQLIRALALTGRGADALAASNGSAAYWRTVSAPIPDRTSSRPTSRCCAVNSLSHAGRAAIWTFRSPASWAATTTSAG